MISLSVILCTHNPRAAALERTLRSLQSQTLTVNDWELIIVDNASSVPLDHELVTWHPAGKVIVEQHLGLTHARLLGISESTADTLCFVDDDNELDPNYLEEAVKIAISRPYIGCWGGEIVGEFEIPPPSWLSKYLSMLAIRPLKRDTWGNSYRYDDSVPCGAGMCVRRPVVQQYIQNCEQSELRKALDRKGNSAASNGDIDLAYTSIDMGLGTGRFKSMRMVHLIPASRLQAPYIEKLAEGMAESNIYLDSCRPETAPLSYPAPTITARIWYFLKWLKSPPQIKRLLDAQQKGIKKGISQVQDTLP